MGTDPEYLEACTWRHAGLEATYIVSCVPDFVEPGRGGPRLTQREKFTATASSIDTVVGCKAAAL
eukprot:COSAG05_NODE_853_length_6963_cov_5.582314_5_plen_65_part_00